MEGENTYYIDHKDERELARLIVQDHIFNEVIDIFPQQFVPSRGKTVVDVACGPGGWALQVSAQHHELSVLGLDISQQMITYARAQAEARTLPAQFMIMNILKPWDDLRDQMFDLINMRFISGFVSVARLADLFRQCWRTLRPGGVIRASDFVFLSAPASPATQKLMFRVFEAYYKAGLSLGAFDLSLIPQFRLLFKKIGFTDITIDPYVVDISLGAQLHDPLLETLRMSQELLNPFWEKTGVGSKEELTHLIEDFEREWAEEDFSALWHICSVCAVKPEG